MKMPVVAMIYHLCPQHFFVRQVCRAYYSGVVSSVQVEIYHTQLEIQSLLLSTELQDFNQGSAQARIFERPTRAMVYDMLTLILQKYVFLVHVT